MGFWQFWGCLFSMELGFCFQ